MHGKQVTSVNPRMNILLLCWRDSTHPQGGGSERYLERVAEYLARQGHQVTYRTAGTSKEQHLPGVHMVRRGGRLGVYVTAALEMLLGRFGTYKDIDVVVDTQNGIPFFARLFLGKPTVLLTHHCHRKQWPVAGWLAPLGWWLESTLAPLIYRGAPYVTVSEPSRRDLVSLGVREEDITIIRNGVDPIPPLEQASPNEQTSPLEQASPIEEAQTSNRHVVTLSRLVPHKQIERAIDIVEEIDDLVLDVIGSGWWESKLRDYTDCPRVIFHGHVSEARKHALLARATLHLLPSRTEGWGLSVIEAAQHGVPTVGYRSSGGLQESVIDGVTGLLADDDLATPTRAILNDPALRDRLSKGALDYAQQFSWEETGAAFEALLLRLAQGADR